MTTLADSVAVSPLRSLQAPSTTRDQIDPVGRLAALPPSVGGGVRVLQTIPSAIAALRANKGRSILTALGIIIGVAAVIAMLALAESASASMRAQLSGLGANVLTVSPGSSQSAGARAGAGSLNTLKADDVAAITQTVHGVTAASAVPAETSLRPGSGGAIFRTLS